MEDEPTPVINIISSKIQNQHGLHQAASNREPTPHSNDEPNAASAAPDGDEGCAAAAILVTVGGWAGAGGGWAGTDAGWPAGAGAAANCLSLR